MRMARVDGVWMMDGPRWVLVNTEKVRDIARARALTVHRDFRTNVTDDGRRAGIGPFFGAFDPMGGFRGSDLRRA